MTAQAIQQAPPWFLLIVIGLLTIGAAGLLSVALWGLKREITRFDSSVASLANEFRTWRESQSAETADLKERVAVVERVCKERHETPSHWSNPGLAT